MPRKRKPPIATQAPYGQGERLADAQRQMPVGAPPGAAVAPARTAGPPPAVPTGGGGMADAIAQAALMAPPTSGGLVKPTAHPDEPITAGLDLGAGPGMGKLGMPLGPEEDKAMQQLILAYQATQSSSIARIIEVLRIRADARNQMIQSGRQPRSVGPARPL